MLLIYSTLTFVTFVVFPFFETQKAQKLFNQ